MCGWVSKEIIKMNWIPKPLCKKDCGNIVDNKHYASAQRMPCGKKDTWGDKPHFKQEQLYVIPNALIHEIFEFLLLLHNEFLILPKV